MSLLMVSLLFTPFSELSIFFKSTSTSLFTDGTFVLKCEHFQEYLIQNSKILKSGGTKYHFKRVKVSGTTPYWKACFLISNKSLWRYQSGD